MVKSRLRWSSECLVTIDPLLNPVITDNFVLRRSNSRLIASRFNLSSVIGLSLNPAFVFSVGVLVCRIC